MGDEVASKRDGSRAPLISSWISPRGNIHQARGRDATTLFVLARAINDELIQRHSYRLSV